MMARYCISHDQFAKIFGKCDGQFSIGTQAGQPSSSDCSSCSSASYHHRPLPPQARSPSPMDTRSLSPMDVDENQPQHYSSLVPPNIHPNPVVQYQLAHHRHGGPMPPLPNQVLYGSNPTMPTSQLTFDQIDKYISVKLKEIENKFRSDSGAEESEGCFLCDEVRKNSNSWSPVGRLGPPHVMFDVKANVGSLIIDSERLGISSHSGFSSIRATVGVFRGKWQYEVNLNTKGVMQVGWATQKCRFSQEKGVGDTENSYAFDGNRVRKWNWNTFVYGEHWYIGDVIGCTIDLEDGSIDFYRNGKHLGLAFNRVRVGPGMVYFPAVSLAYNESLLANFGATPIRYPVPGYQPLQEIPYGEVARADVLLTWLTNLIKIDSSLSSSSIGSVPLSAATTTPATHLPTYLTANLIVQKLSPLLRNKYIVEACLLRKILAMRDNQEIHGLLDLLWTLLERSQLSECLENLTLAMINGYRYSNVITTGTSSNAELITSALNESVSPSFSTATSAFCLSAGGAATTGGSSFQVCPVKFSAQKRYLLSFLALTQHTQTRNYLLKHVLFDKAKFALLLDIKPVTDREALERELFPHVTVSGVLSTEANKLLRSELIETTLSELESLHHMILDTLIFQDELCRIMFIAKFDNFLKETNSFNPLRISVNSSPQQAAPLTVILSFFHRLTSLIRIQYENMINVLPVAFFVDSNCVSNDVTRIGGLVTHLVKAHEKDLHKCVETASSMNPLLKHVYILIDGLIRLYAAGAHKCLSKHCVVRENLGELATAVTNIRTRQPPQSSQLPSSSPASTSSSVQAAMQSAADTQRAVLEQELLLKARQLAWINSSVLTNGRRQDVYWLLRLMLSTLEHASASGSLFSFIPDYYIESCLNLCHAVRFYFGGQRSATTLGTGIPATVSPVDISGSSLAASSPEHEFCFNQLSSEHRHEHDELLKQFGTFLCTHFGDERVANSDLKDSLAQALASLVSSAETLHILETVSIESRIKMIKNLILPYENRAWAHSNWILLRFWKGCGFAYRYTLPPNLANRKNVSLLTNKDVMSSLNYLKPCPSEIFQIHFRDYLTLNKPAANAFISSLLSQLNWSFSEFIGMLQEIQNAANKPEKVFIDSRQLKICCTCYDLTVALLRVLEMIVALHPQLITRADPSGTSGSDLILPQLCTLLNQILNRVTTTTGCFEFVTELEIPGLEPVAHFPLLSAVSGILIALTLHGSPESRESAIKALVADASFVPSNVINLGRDPVMVAGKRIVPNVSIEPSTSTARSVYSAQANAFIPASFFATSSSSGSGSSCSPMPQSSSSAAAAVGSDNNGATKVTKKAFRLTECDEVSEEEVQHLAEMINVLVAHYNALETSSLSEEIPDDELCTICYATKKTAVFEPCGHRSCRSCISMHFLRHQDCFYCKTQLDRVTFSNSDQVLYPKMK